MTHQINNKCDTQQVLKEFLIFADINNYSRNDISLEQLKRELPSSVNCHDNTLKKVLKNFESWKTFKVTGEPLYTTML